LTASPNHVCCEAGRQLAEQFAISARLYAEAVVMLTCNFSSEDYRRLQTDADEARQRSEDTRLAFEEHLKLHGVEAERSE